MPDSGEITGLLGELAEADDSGRERVLDQLIPLVYGELKALARANRYRWSGQPGTGTTSLVHEAYARLAASDGSYPGRRQFFCVASKAMRSILIDNARRHRRQKRGGGVAPLPLNEETLVSAERSAELLALDEALNQLEKREPTLAQIVECRCFGGLTVEETATALELSPATIKRRWTLAKAWLFRELAPTLGNGQTTSEAG